LTFIYISFINQFYFYCISFVPQLFFSYLSPINLSFAFYCIGTVFLLYLFFIFHVSIICRITESEDDTECHLLSFLHHFLQQWWGIFCIERFFGVRFLNRFEVKVIFLSRQNLIYAECFTDLGKLNLLMVVWF